MFDGLMKDIDMTDAAFVLGVRSTELRFYLDYISRCPCRQHTQLTAACCTQGLMPHMPSPSGFSS